MQTITTHHKHIIWHLWLAILGIAWSIAWFMISSINTFASWPVTNFNDVFVWPFVWLQNQQANIHRQYGGNDFGWLAFWRTHKVLSSPATVSINANTKLCTRQVRWLYYNSARWQVLWPLDQDSLNDLITLDNSYNNMTISGWLYIGCDGNNTQVYGQITHTVWSLERKLVAGVTINTQTNSYTQSFANSLTFSNGLSVGYVVDSIGWVATINGQAPTITTITPPTPPSGEWTRPILKTDTDKKICEVRDCSDSYYDGVCGICDLTHNAADTEGKPKTLLIDSPLDFIKQVGNIMKSMTCDISQELVGAYVFSFDVGVTTVKDICQADMYGPVIRKHLAKFLSMYAINVLDMKPDLTRTCSFTDMANQSFEMQGFARMACQLWLMGLKQDGTPDTVFNPDQVVTRAQFATAFNRLINGTADNSSTGVWYAKHLEKLKSSQIMNDISNPIIEEVRGYVMLMMQRAYDVIKK